MVEFEKEELLRIARLSALEIYEQEVPRFVDDLRQLISYLDQIKNVEFSSEIEPVKNINLFRPDAVKTFDADSILDLAPETKDRYFVIPVEATKK
jgi:aspartyl/glutamyl-tRNA(Asn/Gln) amidotransferase C subunit